MKQKLLLCVYGSCLIYFILISTSCSDLIYRESIQKIQHHEIERSVQPRVFDSFVDEPELHKAVARAISHIGDTVHLDVLNQILKAEETNAIKEAIHALGQINYHKSRQILHELIGKPEYQQYAGDIIDALRVNGSAESLQFLNQFCESAADSLTAHAVITMAIIANRTSNGQRMSSSILPYLKSDSEIVRNAAAYYFSRNISRRYIRELITASFQVINTGNKYRYKALSLILDKYGELQADSTLLDTLRTNLMQQLGDRRVPWYTKLYQLSLLPVFKDSISMKKAAAFLTDSIPHIRIKTISVLGQWHTPSVNSILLGYYPDASWIEKGHIIKTFAGIDGRFAYRLIQQNLDQGTPRFKELLLESLSIIKSASAIGLLRQFLQVPNTRLNLYAFQKLKDIGRIRNQDALSLLDSGDPALVTVASEWLYRHPATVPMQKIEETYNMLQEPDGIEAMLALMRVAGLKNQPENIPFLLNALRKSRAQVLFENISHNLKKLGETVPDSLITHSSLFVPPDFVSTEEKISVRLLSNKGEIVLDLWSHVAPFTVANFVHLAKSGFYNGLSFHRVVADFVIQGGDPRGDGWGGPGYYIPCEYNNKPFIRGSVGIATAGKDTGGSQFFICHTEQSHLNGRYTNFGQVREGMQVVDRIQIDDKITNVTIN